MSTEAHQEPNYMAVFWGLLVLTILEVGIFYLPMERHFYVIALVILALTKAFLVAWYFMHLKFERWTLVFVTVIPLALAVDLFLGLLPDVGRIPF
jgi:cytochrome c oxidase subunit 4